MVLNVKLAIEFADELAESPTLCASYRCLATKLAQGYL